MVLQYLDGNLQDETEEELERRLDREESVRKSRAVVFFVLPLLIAFLIFTHYFIEMIEENNRNYSVDSDTSTDVYSTINHTIEDEEVE